MDGWGGREVGRYHYSIGAVATELLLSDDAEDDDEDEDDANENLLSLFSLGGAPSLSLVGLAMPLSRFLSDVWVFSFLLGCVSRYRISKGSQKMRRR